VGIILNPAYVGAALIGIGGALSLNWRIMAISLVMSFALFVCFIIFVILNYVGSVRADDGQAWVVLALFLPGLVVDIAVVALCIPSVQKLRATELVASSSGISIVQAATRASAVVPSSAGAQVAPAMASVQSAMASVQSAPPEDAPRQCTVCMDRSPNTVLLPCKHVFCAECAASLQAQGRASRSCPICRTRISDTMRVFI